MSYEKSPTAGVCRCGTKTYGNRATCSRCRHKAKMVLVNRLKLTREERRRLNDYKYC